MADNPWDLSGGGGGGSSNPWDLSGATTKTKKKGGGLLGTLGRIPGDFLRGAENAAVQSPAALMEIADASAKAILYLQGDKRGDIKPLEKVAKAYGTGLVATAKDPLRDPFTTLLTVLPVYGGAARGALAGSAAVRAAKAGEGVGAVGRAVVKKPTLGPRTIDFQGGLGDTLTARGQYSRATGSAVTQKGVDALLKKRAAAKPKGFAAQRLRARGAKWNERDLRVWEAKTRIPGSTLQALGHTLTPAEVRAMDIVARQVPVDRRIAAQTARLTRAKDAAEANRHQTRIDLDNEARAFIVDGPDGKPMLSPDAPKIQAVYTALENAAGERGNILAGLRLLDRGAQRAATEKGARIAAGGRYVEPTPSKLGKSPAVDAAAKRVERLQRRFDAMYDKRRGKIVTTSRPRTEAQARQRLAELELEHAKAIDSLAAGLFGPTTRADVNARTAHNRKAAKQSRAGGMYAKAKPTVTNEMRNKAAEVAHAAIERNPTHPTNVRWAARVAEIDGLKAALIPEPESLFTGTTPTVGDLGLHVTQKYKSRREDLTQYGGALSIAKTDLERAVARAEGRVAPTGVVGADDIIITGNAPFIPTPVERGRLGGQPRVSSSRSFGRTRKPGSLKTATGGAVERANERLDITNVIAERHAEAVRLASIDRRAKQAAKAGSATPLRNDDVFVWKDFTERGKEHGLITHDTIDPEVRKYLDDPEGVAALPDEGRSVLMKLREAAFERHNWDGEPEHLARLEAAAAQGRGVFVPKKLLGDAGKWNPNLTSAQLGTRVLDDINNAQKAALIYLKLNYLIVQALSNVALNIVQQGFAYPINATRAIKAYRADPVLSAAVQDIIGQGAVVQAAFRGGGPIAHGTQKIAEVMSSKIDKPARLSAFESEANKAGFGGERMRALVFDEANAPLLAEVTQRAKEAIIDYGELSPAEKALVRRILFVYPWQKGALKYAGHFLRDHPVQAAALAALGDRGAEINEGKLGPVPTYLKGAFDVGGRLVNPAGVNVLQTPQQQARAIVALASGQPGPAGASYLNPALGSLVALATGRDDFGRSLPGNPATALRQQFVQDVPAVQILRAATSSRSDLARKILGPEPGSKSFPNPNDAYWRWLIGGLYPRQYSKPALNKNAALEKSGR